MTVETPVKKVSANGNDVATTFSFSPIVIFDPDDLTVTKVVDGIETTLSRGSSSTTYSVSVATYPGTGSIVYPASGGTPLATGESITMKRVLDLEQSTAFPNQGGFYPEVVEEAFDRATMIALQQQDDIDRSIRLPVSETATAASTILPTADLRASLFLAFDSNGDLTTAAGTSANLGPVSAFIDTLLDDTTAAVARATLGSGATGDAVFLATTAAAARTTLGAGTVTSITASTGLSGGAITGSGTIALDINSLTEDTAPATGDFVATYDLSATGIKKVGPRNLVRAGRSLAVISDQKAQNTDGGTFTAGAWRERDLQTEVSDVDGIVSISANRFTLGAGTYYIRAKVPAYQVAEHQARLYNVTDAAVAATGTTERTGGASATMSSSYIETVVTIAGSKAFSIEHWGTSTVSTNGFGIKGNLAAEVYTTVFIERIA